MRTLLRLGLVVGLIASCEPTDPIGPVECVPTPTTYRVTPPSFPLAFGTVGEVVVLMEDGCNGRSLNAAEVDMTVRDTSVAALVDLPGAAAHPERLALLEPRGSGRTYLVVSGTDWIDSARIVVADTVRISSFSAIDAGGMTSCGVTGSAALMCWGASHGPLLAAYPDERVGRCWGLECSPFPIQRAAGVAGVGMGSFHGCLIEDTGRGRCWGANEDFQVSGSPVATVDVPTPVVSTSSFVELYAGGAHTCGLTTDDQIECWGRNSFGQLGMGMTTEKSLIPSVVQGGHVWVSVGVIAESACGVNDLGAFLCWGYLDETGVSIAGSEECSITIPATKGGSATERRVRCATVPLEMPLATTIGASSFFVQTSGPCALTSDGSVGCYRRGTGTVAAVPGGHVFTRLSASAERACALTAAGEAWCWGSGPLGDGGESASASPVAVSGGHVFTDIAVGETHSCALTVDDEAWCWGWNDVGQSGTSILEETLVPTRVRGQG